MTIDQQPAYKLGKTAARHAISLKFENVFDIRKLPKPPAGKFGRYPLVKGKWGMLGNDDYGDCVWAGGAHEDMIFNSMGGRKIAYQTKDILSCYRDVTGFDPAVPDSDQGTDMKQAASYRRKTGLLAIDGTRQMIDGYMALKVGNVEQIEVCTYLFGACGIGVQMPSNAMDQFDAAEPWHRTTQRTSIEGGHYIPHVGRNSVHEQLVVTWGRIQGVTDDWLAHYMDEGVAYLDFSILDALKNTSPDGFDQQALQKYFAAL